MSLKWFHVLFIACSFALAVALGIWSVRAYLATGGQRNLIIGVLSFAGAVSVLVYGRWFLRKADRMHLE